MFNLNRLILIILFLIIFDVFIWQEIIFGEPNKNLELYFLDVGQGDSELVVLPNGPKILIDGGPNNKILQELSSILRPTDRYIDLIILSHTQTDHFVGLIDVLKRYQVGAFVFNGQESDSNSFRDLEKVIKENKVKTITVVENDKIEYQDNYFDILSPSENLLLGAEANGVGLVMKLISSGSKILFTADIDNKIEDDLMKRYGAGLDIDVLKVAHHGSKFSSSEEFLQSASPKISIIEVGKNSYGHPTPVVLNRLALVGSQIFRTDKDSTVKLIIANSQINIFKKQ